MHELHNCNAFTGLLYEHTLPTFSFLSGFVQGQPLKLCTKNITESFASSLRMKSPLIRRRLYSQATLLLGFLNISVTVLTNVQ